MAYQDNLGMTLNSLMLEGLYQETYDLLKNNPDYSLYLTVLRQIYDGLEARFRDPKQRDVLSDHSLKCKVSGEIATREFREEGKFPIPGWPARVPVLEQQRYVRELK